MATYLGRIQLLSKTSTAWLSSNPVLLNGEAGIADTTTEHPILKVGDGVRPWTALPALGDDSPEYVAGPVTSAPPGSPAQVIIDNEADPPTISFVIPRGERGAAGPMGPQGDVGAQGPIGATGPPNTLTIGTVTTGAPGAPADAEITGAAPNQVLSLTIPAGAQGPQGPQGNVGPVGPPNTLTIGEVQTGAPGSAADAVITGAAPNQVLSLTIPAGAQGPQGIQGIQGPPGSAAFAAPSALIGLVAIPGASAFAIRSDGAPALSQAIVPTWTGPHTFSGNGGLDAIVVSGADPVIRFADTNEAADYKGWRILANGGQFRIGKVNDALSVTNIGFQMDCVGNSVSALVFGSAATNPTYSFLGTGLTTHSGPVTITGVLTCNGAAGFDTEAIRIVSPAPMIYWQDSNAGANAGIWVDKIDGNTRRMSISTDGGGYYDYLLVTRAVAAMASIAFGNATHNPTYTFLGTGVVTAGGVLRGPDGSASAPTYSMTTTPGTGMYGASDNSLRFSTNSAITMYLDSSNDRVLCYYQLELNQNGTAARPSFSWVSHTNSGMYKDTNGFIYFSVVGTQQFRIHNTGVEAVAFTSTSSRAIKRETGALTRTGQLLARLRPILYRLLAEDSREQLGLIAQEVQAVCPQLSDGNAVAYDRLALLLLADWQESRGISTTPKG